MTKRAAGDIIDLSSDDDEAMANDAAIDDNSDHEGDDACEIIRYAP